MRVTALLEEKLHLLPKASSQEETTEHNVASARRYVAGQRRLLSEAIRYIKSLSEPEMQEVLSGVQLKKSATDVTGMRLLFGDELDDDGQKGPESPSEEDSQDDDADEGAESEEADGEEEEEASSDSDPGNAERQERVGESVAMQEFVLFGDGST